jgi:HAD superfamily hydrolase (TIGR01490 family)
VAIAFFDVDHTLIRGSTGHYATRYLVARGVLRPKVFAQAAYYTAAHYLGLADAERMMRAAAQVFRGIAVEQVRGWAEDCYVELVRPSLYAKGRLRVEAHRKRGHAVVLLSAGPQLLIEALGRELEAIAMGQDGVQANGVYTGEPMRPITYGQGKLERALAFARARGVTLAECAFYSDSVSDLPLLRAVGAPHAVNPDPRLRRIARRDRWPILAFDG